MGKSRPFISDTQDVEGISSWPRGLWQSMGTTPSPRIPTPGETRGKQRLTHKHSLARDSHDEATTEASQARGPPKPRTAPPHRRGRSDDGRPPPAPRSRASRNIGTRGRRPDPPAAAERRTDADMNQTMRYWQKGIYQAAGLQKSELSVGPTPPPTRPTPWPRSARPRERGRRPTPRRRPPSRR